MSNRRKSGLEKQQKAAASLSVVPPGFGGGFNQMARRSCSECGAGIEWVDGAGAQARGVDLQGAMEFLGVDSIPGRDVWVCTANPEHHGVMGPAEFG